MAPQPGVLASKLTPCQTKNNAIIYCIEYLVCHINFGKLPETRQQKKGLGITKQSGVSYHSVESGVKDCVSVSANVSHQAATRNQFV